MESAAIMPSSFFPDTQKIDEVISLELQLHPLSRPIDMYKLLIQAALGPGHLITDPLQVKNNLISEMEDVTLCNDICFQSLDAGHGYIRYYLSNLLPYKAVSAQRLEQKAGELATAMIASCALQNPTQDLSALWQEQLPLITKRITASEKEWQEVLHFAENRLIPSHSIIYRTAYSPHYRVIRASLMPKKDTL